MKTNQLDQESVRERVRERYGRIVTGDEGCGCAPSCCTPVTTASQPGTKTGQATETARGLGYSAEETTSAPVGSNLGLGCGNPQAIAALRPGETVLDLGSGAGFDTFLAARAVGPSGRVIGVDMTPAMLAKARENQRRGDYPNVEFRLAEIENLPVADGEADVIISNCVINLSPDKPRAFREAFRALKPGGRLAVSDIVALAVMPPELRADWDLLTGCVAGASTVAELQAMLGEAGFTEISVAPKDESPQIVGPWFPGRKVEEYVASASIRAVRPPRT